MADLFDGYGYGFEGRDLDAATSPHAATAGAIGGADGRGMAAGPVPAAVATGTTLRPAPRAAWDEMMAPGGQPRRPYRSVHGTLRRLSGGELGARADALARTYLDQGVTFDFAGEERPFPLDVVPRVISAEEWSQVESGVVQRVRALEAFLADVYGERAAVAAGVIPWRVVASASGFHRVAAGVVPANGVRVHVAGIDLIRDEQGRFRVLEDNVRVPSGVSYVIANRGAMTQVFPEAFATHRITPVSDYPQRLLAALRASAPAGAADPDRGRAHPRDLQQRVLRARPTRPHHGGGAGRGPRPALRRRPGDHAHHRGRTARSTSSTGGWTTSSSTRCSSAPTPSSAARVCSTRPGRATSPSRTPSATGWPTTSWCTATSPS